MKRFIRSFLDGLLVILFFTSLIAIVFVLREGQKEHIVGAPDIIDGDSIRIDNQDIRLAGIDAPELRQICKEGDKDFRCGVTAKQHLETLIGNETVDCKIFGNDIYDRMLAACFVGDIYLNEVMVTNGWAINYGGFAAAEAQAAATKNGLWAGTFDEPEAFRRQLGANNENSIAHRVTFAKLKAIKIGADLARKFGLSGE